MANADPQPGLTGYFLGTGAVGTQIYGGSAQGNAQTGWCTFITSIGCPELARTSVSFSIPNGVTIRGQQTMLAGFNPVGFNGNDAVEFGNDVYIEPLTLPWSIDSSGAATVVGQAESGANRNHGVLQ